MTVELRVPTEVSRVTETLENKGYLAYLVGGCVRDLFMNRKPKDWDIATNAVPDEIIALFPKTVYENTFGTVTVINEEIKDLGLRHIEVTPFRLESAYTDRRHPDSVIFSQNIEDDLARRDFTVNALAFRPKTGELLDLYGGLKDLNDKIIQAVGNPDERFQEDALRILRGARLAAELSFTINAETAKSMAKYVHLLEHVSRERIRDEFSKILMSQHPMDGLRMLRQIGGLFHVAPELEEGVGMEQNGDHIYDVWEHTLHTVQHSADRDWPFHVRLAALLHDIGKPRTRRWSPEKNDWTFYGHDVVGAKMTETILERLKFSRETTDAVNKLVRNHMFFSDIEKITLSAVRRIVRNVGPELVWDLMKVRACDRIGMGRPKENPYRLRKYESMIDEALRAPTSVGMLKIDGKRLMAVTGEKPGPRLGWMLHALLEEALDEPEINTTDYLEKRSLELSKLTDQELKNLGEKGKDKKEEVEAEELEKIRKRHGVK